MWSEFRWPWRWPAALSLAGLAVTAGFVFSLWAGESRFLGDYLSREAAALRWVVFLAGGADVPTLEQKLRALPGLRDLVFVDKDAALKIAQADPSLAEGLKRVSRNPLPESFEARWPVEFLRTEYLVPLSREVESWDGVDRVGYDRSRLDRVALLARLAARRRLAVDAVLFGALAVGLFLAGRWLFYGRRWRGTELLLSAAIGAAAGAAGAGLWAAVGGEWSAVGLTAGAALGGTLGLWRATADE